MKFKKLMTIGLASAIMFGVFSSFAKADDDGFRYIAGKDRVETSILASNYVDSDILVLANAYSFADALSSYNLVASKGAKLILVKDDTDISGILRDKGIKTVYLIGGEKTLKGKPVEDAKKIANTVNRVSGRTRYETNENSLKIAGYESVGVADGRNYPDALAASGLLKKENLGLMLVDGSKTYAASRNVKYTFGGFTSVIQNGGKRIWDINRYKTCESIARKIGYAKNIVITDGKGFADALSSLNFVNLNDGMFIVMAEGVTDRTDAYIPYSLYCSDNLKIGSKFIVGGIAKSAFKDKDYIDSKDNAILKRIHRKEEKKKAEEIKRQEEEKKREQEKKREEYIKTNGIYWYGYEIVGDSNTMLFHSSTSDVNPYLNVVDDLAKNYPNYKLLTTEDEFSKFKKSYSKNGDYKNKVYITMDDRIKQKKFIGGYDSMNKYLFDRLSDGFLEEETLYSNTNGYSSGFSELVRGLGFEYENKTISRIKWTNLLKPTLRIGNEKYTREKFIEKKQKALDLIDESKIKGLDNKSDRAIDFAKFIKVKFSDNEMSTKERIYLYNFAMFELKIPSYLISNTSYSGYYARTKVGDTYKNINLSYAGENVEKEDIRTDSFIIPDEDNEIPNGLVDKDEDINEFYEIIK